MVLFGFVKKVFGMGMIIYKERFIIFEFYRGEKIEVEMLIYVIVNFFFDMGVIGNVIVLYDVLDINLCGIEIYGIEGMLIVLDLNFFDYGRVYLKRYDDKEFIKMLIINLFNYDNLCGFGIFDMVFLIKFLIFFRVLGRFFYYVLEILWVIYILI